MKPEFSYDGLVFMAEHYHYIKASPGRLSGPPEKCYPPEPSEIEDVELCVWSEYSKEWEFVPYPIVDRLMEKDEFYDTLLNAVEEIELIPDEPNYSEDDWQEDR